MQHRIYNRLKSAQGPGHGAYEGTHPYNIVSINSSIRTYKVTDKAVDVIQLREVC